MSITLPTYCSPWEELHSRVQKFWTMLLSYSLYLVTSNTHSSSYLRRYEHSNCYTTLQSHIRPIPKLRSSQKWATASYILHPLHSLYSTCAITSLAAFSIRPWSWHRISFCEQTRGFHGVWLHGSKCNHAELTHVVYWACMYQNGAMRSFFATLLQP